MKLKNLNKVAIIIATYNGSKYLRKQIDSILGQSYKNIKIYVSDDCSEDDTYKIIMEYKRQKPELFEISKNNKNIGFIKNFELLLNKTNEDFIAFCDQDDIWKYDKIEIQMKQMLGMDYKNTSIMLHHDLEMVDENENTIYDSFFEFKNYQLDNTRNLGKILGPCGVMGNTMLINKKLKEIILPFPETIDFHDYYIAVMCEIYGVRYLLKDTIIKYRIHSNNTSNNKYKATFKTTELPYLNRKFSWLYKYNNLDSNDAKIIKLYLDYCQKNITLTLLIKMINFDLFKKSKKYYLKLFIKFLLYKVKNIF